MTVTISRTHIIVGILVAVIVALAAVLLLSGGDDQVSRTADRETAIPVERQSVPAGDDTVANLVIAAIPVLATTERCSQAIEDTNATVRVIQEKGAENTTRTDARSLEIGAITVLDCFDDLEAQFAQLEIDFPVSTRSDEWRETGDGFETFRGRIRDFRLAWGRLRSNLVDAGLLD